MRLRADRCGRAQASSVAVRAVGREPLRTPIERACAGFVPPTPETLLLRNEGGEPAERDGSPGSAPDVRRLEHAVAAVLFAHRLHPKAQSSHAGLRCAFGFSCAEAELLHDGETLAEAGKRSGKASKCSARNCARCFQGPARGGAWTWPGCQSPPWQVGPAAEKRVAMRHAGHAIVACPIEVSSFATPAAADAN